MSDAAGPGQRLLRTWEQLRRLPAGPWLFGRILGRTVPYTGTIRPRLLELEAGRTRVALSDRRQVRNHLGSVHAIALLNLGELATGLSVLTALPAGLRGIVTGLSAEYLRKARGTLTALCDVRGLRLEATRERRDVDAVADITDASGEVVARVTARWRVGP